MRTRIGLQVVLGACAVTTVAIAALALVVVRSHEDSLVRERERGAQQISETIKSSAHDDMLENRRDRLQKQIEKMGTQPGIDSVRLFNRQGGIAFASAPSEIGRSVNQHSESCVACHAAGRALDRLPPSERSRIFSSGSGRVLGIINPIENEASCVACHVHAPADKILGVLDVGVSLSDVDAEIALGRSRIAVLAAITIVATSALLWWLMQRLVLQPVEALVVATRRVAEGDLTTAVASTARHELGDLTRAFNDMTRRLGDVQRQLTQADKLAGLGRLAAGVAHEINNPLTGVLTYASFLLRRVSGTHPEDQGLKEDLEVVVRETKRCRDIVRGLLDFARQTPPRHQATDLNEVVRKAVTILANQLSLHHVLLRLDLAADLPPVRVDANQIQQVVVNLLVNAQDALGESGGTVHLSSRRVAPSAGPGSLAEIVVADNGRGIPAENLPHLFEPFFTTKGAGGTGLGLAITWGIVEAHGGTIDVQSSKGQGSRFAVRLPLTAAKGAPSDG